jgi:hypothetical protein
MRFPRSCVTCRASLFSLLAICTLAAPAFAKGPKPHTAIVGKTRLVYWTPTDDAATRLSLQIRPLFIDGRRKEWVIGDVHDVTDHSFVMLQVQHVNDALPGDKTPHFIWQTGNWLLVERNTGHISPLRFTGYDPALSGLSWFRDYAAFCSLSTTGKALYAEVVELGSHKPVARRKAVNWPLPALPTPLPPPAPVDPTAADSTPPMAPESAPAPHLLPTAAHPVPPRPSVIAILNSGAPHPAACTNIEWDRDPLRAVITPRAGLPPVALELNLAAAAATTTAPE